MASFVIFRPSPAAPSGADEVVLRDGFCPPAALFGPVWALWHGLWLGALGLLALLVAALAIHPILVAAVALLAGWHGVDLRTLSLERRGWTLAGIVVAPTWEEARRRALMLDGAPA